MTSPILVHLDHPPDSVARLEIPEGHPFLAFDPYADPPWLGHPDHHFLAGGESFAMDAIVHVDDLWVMRGCNGPKHARRSAFKFIRADHVIRIMVRTGTEFPPSLADQVKANCDVSDLGAIYGANPDDLAGGLNRPPPSLMPPDLVSLPLRLDRFLDVAHRLLKIAKAVSAMGGQVAPCPQGVLLGELYIASWRVAGAWRALGFVDGWSSIPELRDRTTGLLMFQWAFRGLARRTFMMDETIQVGEHSYHAFTVPKTDIKTLLGVPGKPGSLTVAITPEEVLAFEESLKLIDPLPHSSPPTDLSPGPPANMTPDAPAWGSRLGTKAEHLEYLGYSVRFASKLDDLDRVGAIRLEEVPRAGKRSLWQMAILKPVVAFKDGKSPSSE